MRLVQTTSNDHAAGVHCCNFQEVHLSWSVGHAMVAKALMLGFGAVLRLM